MAAGESSGRFRGAMRVYLRPPRAIDDAIKFVNEALCSTAKYKTVRDVAAPTRSADAN